MSSKQTALATTRDPLAGQLDKMKGVVGQPEDYGQDHHEAPVVPYVQIRQKPLVDEASGDTLRPAGAFKTNDPASTEELPDRKEMLVSIISYRLGRVYFKTVNDTQPTCKSMDGHVGSTQRQGDMYGQCATCSLGQWGGDGARPKCREVRNLFVIDWETERPVIITFSPSAIKPWRNYNAYVERTAEAFKRNAQNQAPFIHHLIGTKLKLVYNAEPAPHYVPEFTAVGFLSEKQQTLTRMARREWMEFMQTAMEKADLRPEDIGSADM